MSQLWRSWHQCLELPEGQLMVPIRYIDIDTPLSYVLTRVSRSGICSICLHHCCAPSCSRPCFLPCAVGATSQPWWQSACYTVAGSNSAKAHCYGVACTLADLAAQSMCRLHNKMHCRAHSDLMWCLFSIADAVCLAPLDRDMSQS